MSDWAIVGTTAIGAAAALAGAVLNGLISERSARGERQARAVEADKEREARRLAQLTTERQTAYRSLLAATQRQIDLLYTVIWHSPKSPGEEAEARYRLVAEIESFRAELRSAVFDAKLFGGDAVRAAASAILRLAERQEKAVAMILTAYDAGGSAQTTFTAAVAAGVQTIAPDEWGRAMEELEAMIREETPDWRP